MIEINEGSHILSIWIGPFTGGDLLAVAEKKKDGVLECNYRFRYYKGRKAFNSNDTKNWYKVTAKEGENEISFVTVVDGVFQKVSEANDDLKLERFDINGNVDKFLEFAKKHPWFHRQEEKTPPNDLQMQELP